MTDTLPASYDALLARLGQLDSLLVAYSGGVDSTLLAVAAARTLPGRVTCVLASSATYPANEIESARALAAELGLPLVEVTSHELDDERFCTNSADRCYWCKQELFGVLRRIAEERGLAHIADGSNADDLDDHRPGRRAAAECGIASPLAEAGMTKADIRAAARALGLPNAEKPSMACLASRLPYGERVTSETLKRVGSAEDALRELGLGQFRVRAHGELARVEIAPEELDAAWALREPIAERVKAAGFTWVAIDAEGYRSGSMNDALAPEARETGR